MKNIYTYRKRAFLNPVSTNQTSYILAHVEDSEHGENKFGTNLITLADCKRRIQLEFFLGTARHRRISLKKINLLIDILIAFRDALLREIAAIEKSK
ncbi:MAG TPA: hypothetical protein VGQ41_20550 [Pyrinomonadaceae bacterium]|nr:hypothetical protein [Pyrinomonadaceae bacterium]